MSAGAFSCMIVHGFQTKFHFCIYPSLLQICSGFQWSIAVPPTNSSSYSRACRVFSITSVHCYATARSLKMDEPKAIQNLWIFSKYMHCRQDACPVNAKILSCAVTSATEKNDIFQHFLFCICIRSLLGSMDLYGLKMNHDDSNMNLKYSNANPVLL